MPLRGAVLSRSRATVLLPSQGIASDGEVKVLAEPVHKWRDLRGEVQNVTLLEEGVFGESEIMLTMTMSCRTQPSGADVH